MIKNGREFFFVEDEVGSLENDTRDRGSYTPTIKYLVCTGKKDWSCPYISVNLLEQIEITEQEWGGWNAFNVKEFWVGSYMSFLIHRYH